MSTPKIFKLRFHELAWADYRLVYRVVADVVTEIAVGKRDKSAVYDTAKTRLP